MKINSGHSPTLFLIILKNHLIQFQKVNFFSRGTFKNRIIKKREYIKLDRDKSAFKSHRDFCSEKEITFKHL